AQREFELTPCAPSALPPFRGTHPEDWQSQILGCPGWGAGVPLFWVVGDVMSTTNDLFAIAAHLHVVLRRKTGRVTDTEWMATNPEYAAAMVAFARAQA